jgi:hypothetical protein
LKPVKDSFFYFFFNLKKKNLCINHIISCLTKLPSERRGRIPIVLGRQSPTDEYCPFRCSTVPSFPLQLLLQWLPYKVQSLHSPQSARVVNCRFFPQERLLRLFLSLGRRILTANGPYSRDMAGDLYSEQWFSRPYKELRQLMPRKWRGFPLRNPFFSQ